VDLSWTVPLLTDPRLPTIEFLPEAGGLRVRELSGITLRANPLYILVPFAQLPQEERQLLAGLERGNRYAGILKNRDAGTLSIQAVSPAVALIFSQLLRARSADCLDFDGPRSERDAILAGLVLDGVLELEDKSGLFVSQTAAYCSLIEGDVDLIGPSRVARLSVRALRHGEQLGLGSPATLAARMYFFNRLPATPRWHELWPDAGAVQRYLAVNEGGALRPELCAQLSRSETNTGISSWIFWKATKRDHSPAGGSGRYKLYVSVMPECLAASFAELVRLVPDHDVAAMKIGSDAHGLLRPDKLMVYFDRPDDLFGFANALLPKLAGLSAHGVPFSASLDKAGMLSWGVDPPREAGQVAWYQDDSFRIWICNRLAMALLTAQRFPIRGVPPWRYALAKLWLAGLDTRAWTLRPNNDVSSQANN
jgi:hypothetical protein